MRSEHEDELEDVASHLCPGFTLAIRQQPYFLNVDALNYAMIDHLTEFSSKVREREACLILRYGRGGGGGGGGETLGLLPKLRPFPSLPLFFYYLILLHKV